MKNKSTLLFMAFAIATMLTGCKKNMIDIDEQLGEIAEETFANAPSRSYVGTNGHNFVVVEYSFDAASKTAVRKELNFAQNAAYTGLASTQYTYEWGAFHQQSAGRELHLFDNNGGEIVMEYVNDKLDDGNRVYDIKEARAEMASNMIAGLTAGEWEMEDLTYILQEFWVDTTVVIYKRVGKKYVNDTIFMRMPRPNYYDTIGINNCRTYSYNFNNAADKNAKLTVSFLQNNVKADTTFLPKHQDPSLNDTIVTYTYTAGTPAVEKVEDFTYWTLTGISTSVSKETKETLNNLDLEVGTADKNEAMAITAFKYDGEKGSFVINNKTYNLKK